MPPAMIFANRFALNGSSRHATISALWVFPSKTVEPSSAHCGRCGAELGDGNEKRNRCHYRPHAGSLTTPAFRHLETTAPLCVMHVKISPRKSNAGSGLRSRPGTRFAFPLRKGIPRGLDTELYGETNDQDFMGTAFPLADPSISGQLPGSRGTGN